MVAIFLCQLRLDQEKPLLWLRRILDMIGRGVGIDQLFISTFTVKAAGELKKSVWKSV